ncbi:class IV lanthionine synthetase LanL [Streptomyces sp. YIM 98790]|uniref:class IV lanthionine synthetase LanL n=1 Tax=Streptomyces sp. YIM 98790 TaxID=2689077 RepID=UPI001408623C|nr:class IV lanthionine synthetase LanL [Streptomyces sp. YIM 98790]
MTGRVTEGGLEHLLDNALSTIGTGTPWTVTTDGMWCRVTPGTGELREQGWKLHLSATAASAPTVLERALGVLLSEDSAFKFARSLDQVTTLNARSTPRGNSGKFLTVYPRSDEAAARLARDLHRATSGLAGPRILSDRPYTAGSLVHYRYGSFVGRRRLSEDGLMVWYVRDPDGNPVEDKRTGEYVPPPWAVSPFPEEPGVPVKPPAPRGPVMLGGRFAVREAIRHTNKGGVYRGTDTRTGAPVVIKEARPHVEADASGRDVRDWLRAEARMLQKLAGLGLAPEALAVFDHGQHLFLAQEEVPGVTLRTWTAEHFRDAGPDRYRADALALVGRLVDLVAAAHAQRCVLRDLSPGNVVVRPDGALRLIDLELAVPDDGSAEPTRLGTPGFSAPERLTDAPVSPTADYYSLGATACFVLAGRVPELLPEEPADRPADERMAAWLGACAGRLRLPDGVVTMLLGLLREDPAARWDPGRARAALRASVAPPVSGRGRRVPAAARAPGDRPSEPASSEPARPEAPEGVREAVAGIVDYLIDSMTPADDRRLWPVSTTAGETDPCTVQQGAAGVLAVLTRYYELTGDPRLPRVISTAGHWIMRRTGTRRARPGLHFGGPGTAWALYDAGRAVGDDRLTGHALALATAPLESSPSHDITHGTAGSGLAALHLWERTRDARFAELAVAAADRLAAAARREPAGVSWAVPAEAVSRLAGKRHLGFAHGVAGIGCFLLCAAAVSDRPAHLELAVDAGEQLLARAVVAGEAANWPTQAADPPTSPYWCHGAAGVGTFLIRLHRATGDPRFGDLARRGTRAVADHAPRAPLTQCHGLAGNGDFLLDMADATGEAAHRSLAGELARLILAQQARRNGHVVFPNEFGDVSASWSDGAAGILAFLLRLRHASPRHWMVRPPVPLTAAP